MPKQINVKMGFEADISQAKRQIQDLQKSLDNLLSSSAKKTILGELDTDIIKAEQSVLKLKTALNGSLNADTGRLDLSKFTNQLGQADLTIGKIANDMAMFGSDGQKAFLNLTNSIITAQKPIAETNKLIDGMWTALKNTARWQLSSSLLHGFMGAISGAYGYAQDLDKSLNSIRIVSGQSAEEMAAFADQANRSAQALSTSTLAYTDAALIFYQQGLSGDAVTERVDTVLKLSNVTGDSAEQVSNYMTAIWNNFYDGSQSLESFADKITALGAATASSSAEISAGLQQFAAIGNTVGLSYDYAATALATIVAQTRQSESTVGNGLRTIFARLSSLKQGDTDEDGTDLTKYTKALGEVGISVKDQNGQLKEMDAILNDIGAKWQTLSKNQQVALAQTVGGVRQYATLIALFDNWDQFQRNLTVTQNAEGTLQEQADVYAESWEAARKRVQASWQSIYQDLIDEKFFIGLADGLSTLLKGVDGLIDSLGGLKGVLSGIGIVFTSVFNKQMVGAVEGFQQRLKYATGVAQAEADAITLSIKEAANNMVYNDIGDTAAAFEIDSLKQQLTLTLDLKEVYNDLTDKQKEYGNSLLSSLSTYQKIALEAKKTAETMKESYFDSVRQARSTFLGNKDLDKYFNKGVMLRNEKGQFTAGLGVNFNEDIEKIQQLTKGTEEWNKAYDETLQHLIQITGAEKNEIKVLTSLIDARLKSTEADEKANDAMDISEKKLQEVGQEIQNLKNLKEQNISVTIEQINAIEKEIERLSQEGEQTEETIQKIARYRKEVELLKQNLDGGIYSQSFAKNIVETAGAVNGVVFGVNAIANGIKSLTDENLTPWEKFSRLMTGMSLGGMQLFGSLGKLIPKLINTRDIMIASTVATNATGKAFSGLFAGLSQAGEQAISGTLLTPLGKFVIIAALVGAAAYSIYKWWNKDAEAAKKAAEAAKEAKEAYQQTQEEFNNLISTLENHQQAVKALDDLKQGTIEWYQAVEKINSSVLDLLDKYPELAQFVEIIDGVYRISSEGMEFLSEQGYKKLLESRIDYINKNNTSKEASWISDVTDLRRNYKVLHDDDESDRAHAISIEEMTALMKAWESSNGEAFNSAKSLGEELKKLGYSALAADEAFKMTVIGQKGLINDLQSSYSAGNINNETANLQIRQLASEGVTTTIGADISKVVAGTENSYLDSSIKEILEEEVYQKMLEAGELTTEAYFDLIQKARDDFNQNSDQYIKEAQDRETASIDQIDGLREIYDQFTDEDKRLMLTMDIDKEESKEQVLARFAELRSELKDNIESIRLTLDTDVDEEEWETLTNYLHENADEINKNAEAQERLSQDLLINKQAAAEVAEEILRFDDAIQDVTDNYDRWIDALNAKDVEELALVGAELKDTYGDLFDLDGSQLSSDFIEDTKNLELMKEAINGNTDAYNELLEAAGQDIITHLHLSDDDLTNFYAELNNVQSMLDAMNFQNLEIGAELNNQSFLDALSEMVNAAHMTKEQAEAYLASMGIDAKITQHDAETEEVQEVRGSYPDIDWVEDEKSYYSIASGEDSATQVPLPGFYPKVTYQPQDPVPITSKKKATGFTLEVTSATKKSGGEFKFNQTTHGAGSQGKGNTHGSGGKGGGGSSSPKKKTVKEHKKPEQKTDRYHDIKERIEDLNRELKRLEKTESRVYGKAKLKYMDQEISKLEKQIDLTDEYIEEIKKYAKEDQARLRGINMGATFDDNGRLNNYEQVLANIVADYNNAVDVYNNAVDTFNGSAQEDADNAMMESAEKALSNAKDTYDEYLKILDQYEDTFNLLEEKIDERIDQVWALFDMRVKQVVFKIDFELDWNEKEIEHLQWLLKYTGKAGDNAADSIANLAKQMEIYGESIEVAKEGIAEIFKAHKISFDFDNADPTVLYNQLATFMDANQLESQLTEEEANALIKWMEQLRDYYDGIYENWEQAHEVLVEAWEESTQKIQDNIDVLDQYANELQHIRKVIDLVGQDILNISTQDMDKLLQVQVQNAQNQITVAIAQRDLAASYLEGREKALQEALDNGYDKKVIDQLKEEARDAKNAYTDAVNDVYAATENALEMAQDRFDTFIENTTRDYKKSFGKMGLDYIQEQFARQKELDELYLDDFQKYHELNKTSNELNKSLASTDNLEIRQKLLDLQDEINASMETGAKVSSAQAEIYARRVALLQAESELLDAQNAKSAVRMTRDNEGNFSYTYTADQEQIDDAQQNYGDKFYELLQFERDYAIQLQEDMLQKFQDFIDRRNEIAQTYKEGSDEFIQAMEDLENEYLIYMDYFTDELNMDMDEMARLRDDDWKDFERYNGVKLAEYDDFLGKFNQLTIGKLMPEYNSMNQLASDWTTKMKESCTQAYTAVNNYQVDTKRSFEAAGLDITNYGKTVSERLDDIAKESDETAEATRQMSEDMAEYMQRVADDADEMDRQWGSVMESMRNQIDHTITALSNLLQQLDLVKEKANEAMIAAQNAMNAGASSGWAGDWGGGGDSGGDSGGGSGAGGGNSGGAKTVVNTYWDYDGYGWRTLVTVYSDGSTSRGSREKTPLSYGGDYSYDTGGYTGDFGPAGKWAILHEKEIVLNKEDTANMLNIVGMVRDMVGLFNLNQRLDNLLSMATAATGVVESQTQSLDQNVHIEASFPNVQSHTEIELALNNLINSASQFVNRK